MSPVLSLLKQLLTAKQLTGHPLVCLAKGDDPRSHSYRKLCDLYSVFLCEQKMSELMNHHDNGKYQQCRNNIHSNNQPLFSLFMRNFYICRSFEETPDINSLEFFIFFNFCIYLCLHRKNLIQ